ncbi:MAG: hypothetical protein HYZ15_05805 [Sphingobacteriales bacterium]|nr:hypothetical protein [Sphingobacteriales bacterium]
MKKILFVLVITGVNFCFPAGAQFTKGDRILGAGLSFQHAANESNSGFTPFSGKSTTGSISLDLGFATKESRMSGFYINGAYGKSKTEYPDQPGLNNSSENYSTGAGFFSRRYKSIGKNFLLFAEGRAGVSYSALNVSGGNSGDQATVSVQAGLYPGLSYKAGKHFLLDLRFADFASINYNHSKIKGPGDTKNVQNSFGFSSSLGLGYLQNIGIGARWIIPAGKK